MDVRRVGRSPFEGEFLEVSMGPQHPSTHGVFRMDVCSKAIVKLKPVFGYLHRNHEKIGENTTYLGSMPYTDRLDYFCSMTNNWAYALSVEKLAGIEVPERAEYLRVILAELTRLLNHSCLLGFLLRTWAPGHAADVCVSRARKNSRSLRVVVRLRMMCDYMRFGGCRGRFAARLDRAGEEDGRWFPEFPRRVRKVDFGNEILIARTQGVGELSPNSRSMPASPARCCAPPA